MNSIITKSIFVRFLGLAALLLLATVLASPVGATSSYKLISTDTTLTEDYYGNIDIITGGVTLDCAGHRVISTEPGQGTGIHLEGYDGVTIKNCHVSGFELGIWLWNSSNNIVENNTVTNNDLGFAMNYVHNSEYVKNVADGNYVVGFQIADSNGNTFSENTANDNIWGFNLHQPSNENILSNNQANRNSGTAYSLVNCQDNTLVENEAVDNGQTGFRLGNSANNSLLENTAIGNWGDGFELFEEIDAAIPTSGNSILGNRSELNYNGFKFFWVNDNRIEENHTSGNYLDGFRVHHSSGNEFSDNGSLNNRNGVHLIKAHSNFFSENETTTNDDSGFWINESNGNVFIENIANSNGWDGFGLADSSYNEFIGNKAYYNAEDGFNTKWSTFANILRENEACDNAVTRPGYDALDDYPANDIWEENEFCTYSGFEQSE